MDRNSTLQASIQARGPILCNQSIELNKLNNFRSICLYKIFTSKKILEWTEIRLSRRAFRPVGLFFAINRQSSINSTTFVLYVLRRYLQVKSYESKCFKILSKFFRRFSGPGELRRLWSHIIENETMRTITPCLPSQKISASQLLQFLRKSLDNETL